MQDKIATAIGWFFTGLFIAYSVEALLYRVLP